MTTTGSTNLDPDNPDRRGVNPTPDPVGPDSPVGPVEPDTDTDDTDDDDDAGTDDPAPTQP